MGCKAYRKKQKRDEKVQNNSTCNRHGDRGRTISSICRIRLLWSTRQSAYWKIFRLFCISCKRTDRLCTVWNRRASCQKIIVTVTPNSRSLDANFYYLEVQETEYVQKEATLATPPMINAPPATYAPQSSSSIPTPGNKVDNKPLATSPGHASF